MASNRPLISKTSLIRELWTLKKLIPVNDSVSPIACKSTQVRLFRATVNSEIQKTLRNNESKRMIFATYLEQDKELPSTENKNTSKPKEVDLKAGKSQIRLGKSNMSRFEQFARFHIRKLVNLLTESELSDPFAELDKHMGCSMQDYLTLRTLPNLRKNLSKQHTMSSSSSSENAGQVPISTVSSSSSKAPVQSHSSDVSSSSKDAVTIVEWICICLSVKISNFIRELINNNNNSREKVWGFKNKDIENLLIDKGIYNFESNCPPPKLNVFLPLCQDT